MRIPSGTYIVPTNRWYIERTVWLIAGVVLLASSTLALLWNPLWILGVAATGLVSINVALTGFCPVGNVLRLFGFTPMLGSVTPTRWNLYFLQTDRWYLERRIYITVGVNISIASVLVLTLSPWWMLFTFFVGAGRSCGSPPPAFASWPMRSTGSASSRNSIRKQCRRVEAPPCMCPIPGHGATPYNRRA